MSWPTEVCELYVGKMMEWGPRESLSPEFRGWLSCGESYRRADEQSWGQVRSGVHHQGTHCGGLNTWLLFPGIWGKSYLVQLQVVPSYILMLSSYHNAFSNPLASRAFVGPDVCKQNRWVRGVWPAHISLFLGLLGAVAFFQGNW